ncbi:NAD(P)H-binding protein [Pseudonocardia sp. GCM10023141]|uniref:NAD(P)H-binding protein n=1 Tax=Pseudonocardia sp. GCM10023141 TaxID=3252653 RepID=UPI00360D2981
MHCLVIGATGYIGALLVPRLLADGHSVACLVRDEAKLARHDWADRVDVHVGDVADPVAVGAACRGAEALFYLVHSMDGPGFEGRDRHAAETVAAAARDAGVARIVYLGGLQPAGVATSPHLASRREVGEILLASGVPTAVLQAGIVVGSGSASFEIIRSLTEASPVLPMPDHAWNRVQPIGIDDVLHHLVAAASLAPEVSGSFDIGGADVLTYRELMTTYAEIAGLPRPVTVPVPVSMPRLTARVAAVVTPADRHLVAPLLVSMAHDLVCRTASPTDPPPGGPTSYAEAVRRAVRDGSGREFVTERVDAVPAPVSALWDVIAGVGGDTGWYSVPGLFAARDRWAVADVEPGHVLRLRSEVALPGAATLELRAERVELHTSRLVLRAAFRPCGAAGLVYGRAHAPARKFLLAVLARTIARVAAR